MSPIAPFAFLLERASASNFKKLDKTAWAQSVFQKRLSLEHYGWMLIQIYHYLRPGPGQFAKALHRPDIRDRDFRNYLQLHAAIDLEMIKLLLRDLKDLGVGLKRLERTPQHSETGKLVNAVETLYQDPDPGRILVSDLVVKHLLCRYASKTVEAVWPRLPRPPNGTLFLQTLAVAQRDMRAGADQILESNITPDHQVKFLSEFRRLCELFRRLLCAQPE